MQELLGRISRLDPSASLGLRVIACFDELVIGNVNSRALLAAAASLAGCTAGFAQSGPSRSMRITPAGNHAPNRPGEGVSNDDAHRYTDEHGRITVWLERDGEPLANDAIILERLAFALRVRHAKGSTELDHRRHLGVLVDREAELEDRLRAAAAVGLVSNQRYRVVAAPLFAVWATHPNGPQDVIATPYGPLHAMVLPEAVESVDASPCGVGSAATPEGLHTSFRSALVALRLCSPPAEPTVRADDYGGLIDLLAESGTDLDHRDAQALVKVAEYPWGIETVAAIVGAQTVREAARSLQVHHSTLQSRLDAITQTLGFNPHEGLGRSRLAMAYLVYRLRTSTVLDMPAPQS